MIASSDVDCAAYVFVIISNRMVILPRTVRNIYCTRSHEPGLSRCPSQTFLLRIMLSNYYIIRIDLVSKAFLYLFCWIDTMCAKNKLENASKKENRRSRRSVACYLRGVCVACARRVRGVYGRRHIMRAITCYRRGRSECGEGTQLAGAGRACIMDAQ